MPRLLFLALLRPLAMIPTFGRVLTEAPDTRLWVVYLVTLDPGPMWFVEALLVMSLVYVPVRGVRERRAVVGATPPVTAEDGPLRRFVPAMVFTVGSALVTIVWRWAFPAPYRPVVGLSRP
ncbi:hypothetical protein [Nocardiopsis sp. MG754419]|uniref:hypothetical protein n=1 Tax=Nocardiopsis sp. MG754419 TaxID=2259865 RepID=UPI00201320E6|nr:hypothetical protein [Nocardiopsis sp. MG754419]